MIRIILIAVITSLLASCTPPLIEITFLPHLKQVDPLTAQQIENNRKIKKEYENKQALLLKIAKLDRIELKQLEKKKENIRKIEKQLTALTTAETIGKKGDVTEILEIVTSAKEIGILGKMLREKTDMSEENIQKTLKVKAQLMREQKELRLDALAKIHARLLRNRKLKIDDVFCAKTSPLDQFVITPVNYSLDVHTVDKKSVNLLFDNIYDIYDELGRYPDMILQAEGNADERGSSSYNKSLGDYRWSGIIPLLKAAQLDGRKLRGVSRGEECPTDRKTDDMEAWWAENRRSDLVWVLASSKPHREQGTITLDKGVLRIHRNKYSQLYEEKGKVLSVFENDKIETGLASQARIVFAADNSKIKLFSYSHFLIKKIDPKETSVHLSAGKGQFSVIKRKKRGQRFRIRTTNAMVAVKGTEFIVGAEGEETSVLALQGTVSLANISTPEVEVEIGKNTASRVSGHTLPTEPVIVPSEVLEKIVKTDSLASFQLVKYGKPVTVSKEEIPLPVIPDSPELYTVAGDSQIKIIWDDVLDATHYNLYWSNQPGVNKTNGNKISNLKSGFIHQNLENGTPYYYVITAVNDSSESVESVEKKTTPQIWLFRFLKEQQEKLKKILTE